MNSPTNRRALGILLTGNVLFAAGLIVHAVLFNFYVRELGHTASAMGYQVAAMTLGGLCGLIPAGWMIDTRGTRAALLAGTAVTVLGLVVTAVTRSIAEVYAAAFIVGVGGATCRVAFGPAIMRFTSAHARARIFAWNTALLIGSGSLWTFVAGMAPTALGGTAIAGRLPMSPLQVALVIGALVTACALPLYAMLPVATHERSSASDVVLLPPANLRPSIALVALWMLAAALVLPFFNIWFTDRFAMSLAGVGRTFAIVQLATALVLVVAGEAARRWGARRVLVGWLVLMAPALLGLSVVGALNVAVALYFVQGVVAPATNPLIDQLLLERAPASRHGIVASWRNAAAEASGAVGATIGGQILDATSFATLFVCAAGMAAVSALGLAAAFRPTSNVVPDQRPA